MAVDMAGEMRLQLRYKAQIDAGARDTSEGGFIGLIQFTRAWAMMVERNGLPPPSGPHTKFERR